MTIAANTIWGRYSEPHIRATDVVMALIAMTGTAGFAGSFYGPGGDSRIPEIAAAIGWAAAASWLGLGAVLVAAHRLNSPPLRGIPLVAWFRICLTTMNVGIAILSCGTALNWLWFTPASAGYGFIVTHVGILSAADVVMGTVFIFRARSLGVSWVYPLALWVLVLNGLFTCTLFLLLPIP